MNGLNAVLVICFGCLLSPSLHAETTPTFRVSAILDRYYFQLLMILLSTSSRPYGNFSFHYCRVDANGSEKWPAVATVVSQYRKRIGVLQVITPQAPRPRPIPCLCAISSYQVPKWMVFMRGKRVWLLFQPGWEVLLKMLPILRMVYLNLTFSSCQQATINSLLTFPLFFSYLLLLLFFAIDNRRICLLRNVVLVCPAITGRSSESLA